MPVRWVVEPPVLPSAPPTPTRSYFVCGTPRAGTWLLCGLLESTGLAGRPHEYFWRETERANATAWRTETFDDYVRAVLAVGTTPNGVFGAKLMWGYFEEFLARLGCEPAGRFPDPRYVWIRRGDRPLLAALSRRTAGAPAGVRRA